MLRGQDGAYDRMSFLAGTSEMATRIRDFDWRHHPLGPPEYWPQALKSALSICLNSKFPTAIYWGPELRLLYNDAWAPIPGPRHPDALGQPAEIVWSDIWHIIKPQFAHLVGTGEGIFVEDQMLPMKRFGWLEETYWNYNFTPIRGEDGAIEGVFNSGNETTQTVLAQRQADFFLGLTEAFRASKNIAEIRDRATKMLGDFLNVDRVGLRERLPGEEGVSLTAQWESPGTEALDQNTNFENFGTAFLTEVSEGRVVKFNDCTNTSQPFRATANYLLTNGARAAMAVPWMQRDLLTGWLFVHSTQPRHWTDHELSTTRGTLERTLTWIDRERTHERERVMMREIDHRARNVLAVVQSVVRLTPVRSGEQFRADILDRIGALAQSHSLLSSNQWEKVNLRTLADRELSPYLQTGSRSVTYGGERVLLNPTDGQAVALVLHELTTNAAKYGALASADGTLRINWHVDESDVLRVEWLEDGIEGGASKSDFHAKGFGSQLIEQIVERQLGGHLQQSFDGSRLSWILALPLTNTDVSRATPKPNHRGDEAQMQPNATKSVLIVEDEVLVAMDMEAMVGDLGYRIFGTFNSLSEAREAIATDIPDLAVLDMNLSGTSSIPLAQDLVEKGVPIAFASGYNRLENLPETLNEAPRLSKPVSADALGVVLKNLSE